MKNVDTVIYARWIMPIAPKNITLEDHALAINGDRIIGILPASQAKQQWQTSEEIHFTDHVVMPGLVNAHTHAPMNLFRGLADDLPLMDWLQQHIWPAELAILNDESVQDGTNLAILEMLRGGTTCFSDHYFFQDAIARSAVNAGIRACVGLWVGSVPTLWAKTEDEYFTKVETSLNQGTPNPLVNWVLAPHSPYIVSQDAFRKIKILSDKFNVPVHIHLHETATEIQDSLKKYGQRPMAWLNDLGLLSPRLVGVHMTQLTAAEISLAKSTGMQVVHCPESNLKLASGFAPIAELLAAGITVALGTDGAASNNDLDMFGELQSAALLAKGVSGNPTSIPASQALEMATLNGAKAFGLDKEIGSLEPGKAADIIAIDLSSFLTQPVYNPMSQLAYAVNRQQVSDVWVAGKRLLKNGQFTQLDSTAIVAKAQQWAEKAMPFRSKASLLV